MNDTSVPLLPWGPTAGNERWQDTSFVVGPGYVDTGRARKRNDAVTSRLLHKAAVCVAGDAPFIRIKRAEELAKVIAFIVNRKAKFMTGSVITVDSGFCRSVP